MVESIPSRNRPYDIIVFGATSFVGQLLCRYFVETFNDLECETLRWAIAGRSMSKLESVVAKIGLATDIDLIIADVSDRDSIVEMVSKTRVLITTVGPYNSYGEPVLRACVDAGTDYCDLTGEAHWIRKMMNKYTDMARKTGSRIVHCSGFDSIPSDMGVYFTQKESLKVFGSYCSKIHMRVLDIKGGMSGGTVASMLDMIRTQQNESDAYKDLVKNPHCLEDKPECHSRRMTWIKKVFYDDTFQRWGGPFLMASINTPIVFRSNSLMGYRYGIDFQYNEGHLQRPGHIGLVIAYLYWLALILFFSICTFALPRKFLEKYILPKPGEGPSLALQKTGFYDIRFSGSTSTGDSIITSVFGVGDPGYGSTCKLLGQVGASLALDLHTGGVKNTDHEGGFWTTSALLGDVLLERLEKYADIKFTRMIMSRNGDIK